MKNKKKEPWEQYMTPEDYRLVTSHMDRRARKIFNGGFDDANQLMGLASFGLIKGQKEKMSPKEYAKARKLLSEYLKRLDEARREE